MPPQPPAATAPPADAARCPCLSGLVYGECCGPLLRGEALAPTAERLMRSRFTAFATADEAYLLASWHPSTRPTSLQLDPGVRWFRLDIEATSEGGPFDVRGVVRFTAHHRDAHGAARQHETSRFLREAGRWLYLDGA
jgi:SEC-C motif-containing protein